MRGFLASLLPLAVIGWGLGHLGNVDVMALVALVRGVMP